MNGCNSFGNCDCIIWILILLLCCGGCGNNGYSSGCGCILPLIVVLCCCCGCGNNYGGKC